MLFDFEDEHDRKIIFCKTPWAVKRHCLTLKKVGIQSYFGGGAVKLDLIVSPNWPEIGTK